MKLPLWVKDRETGKWEIFPIHLMETFPDGRQGFRYIRIFGDGYENPYWQALKRYGYDGGFRVLEVDGHSKRRRILIKQ